MMLTSHCKVRSVCTGGKSFVLFSSFSAEIHFNFNYFTEVVCMLGFLFFFILFCFNCIKIKGNI